MPKGSVNFGEKSWSLFFIYILENQVIIVKCNTCGISIPMTWSKLDQVCTLCKSWVESLTSNKEGTKFLRLDIVMDVYNATRKKYLYYKCHDEGHIVGPLSLTSCLRPKFKSDGCRGCYNSYLKEHKGVYSDGEVKKKDGKGIVRYKQTRKLMAILENSSYKLPNGSEIKLESKAEKDCLHNLVKKRFADDWEKFKFGHQSLDNDDTNEQCTFVAVII